MKMRLTVPGGARGAWLTVGRSAAGVVLVTAAVSACTGGGSIPSTFRPTPQTGAQTGAQSGAHASSPTGHTSGSPARSSAATSPSGAAHTSSASAHASSPAHASAPVSSRASVSASANPSVTTILPSTPPPSTAFPTAAPQTGGGGTAGLQDGLLFGIGGAAILAGFGSLAYRRRLARKLGGDQTAQRARDDQEARR